jgi:Cu2+-exporting ATPase
MLFELGIVFTAYAGVRLFEKNRHSKQKNAVSVKQTQLALTETVKAEKKEQQHYLTMCGVAMGIGAIRQFVFISPPLILLNLAAYSYVAFPYFKRVEKSVFQERKVDGYVLYFVADTTAFALGQYLAAAIGASFFHVAGAVISRVQGHSKKTLLNVFEQQTPQNVWLLKDNVELEIPLNAIKNGDIIVIRSGDVIPVDGVVIEGIASIDQHALTGESRPIDKLPGDPVLAATIVVTGRIFIRVEKSGQETAIAKINQILNRSLDFKTNLQLKGEQWADMWVSPMIAIAGLSLPLLGPVGFVMILNSHFSSRIRITASLSTLNYISAASHKGILIKDGRALETLNQIDVVLFDKTGTLTHQDNEVVRIIVSNHYQENEVLAYAAAAERYVAHPIAKAIFKKAEKLHCNIPSLTDESKYQIGYGITVNLEAENKIIRVGSSRFILNEGINIPSEINAAETQAHLDGHSLVIVAINDKVGGAIELQNLVRPEVKEVLKQLRQTGIKHIAIVSGDHKRPTQKLAELLGMDSYYYDITPENKADIVEQLQKSGKSVCFVGDGINDAIAMKQANVSISIHGATSIATDVAEVILMDGTLNNLADIFKVSKDLESNLQNSFRINVVPSIIRIGGLLLLNFGILTGVIIDVIFFFIAIGNSMLPLKKIEHEKTALQMDGKNKLAKKTALKLDNSSQPSQEN